MLNIKYINSINAYYDTNTNGVVVIFTHQISDEYFITLYRVFIEFKTNELCTIVLQHIDITHNGQYENIIDIEQFDCTNDNIIESIKNKCIEYEQNERKKSYFDNIDYDDIV